MVKKIKSGANMSFVDISMPLLLSDIKENETRRDKMRQLGRELMEAEHERDMENLRYEAVMDMVDQGVINVTIDGIIIEANRAFCKMVGRTKAELIGKHLRIVEAQQNDQEIEQHIRKVMSAGDKGYRFTTRHRAKDGEVVNVVVYSKFINSRYLCSTITPHVREIT